MELPPNQPNEERYDVSGLERERLGNGNEGVTDKPVESRPEQSDPVSRLQQLDISDADRLRTAAKETQDAEHNLSLAETEGNKDLISLAKRRLKVAREDQKRLLGEIVPGKLDDQP